MEQTPDHIQVEVGPWQHGPCKLGTGYEIILTARGETIDARKDDIVALYREIFPHRAYSSEQEILDDDIHHKFTFSGYAENPQELAPFLAGLEKMGISCPDTGHLFEAQATGQKPEVKVEKPSHEGMAGPDDNALKL